MTKKYYQKLENQTHQNSANSTIFTKRQLEIKTLSSKIFKKKMMKMLQVCFFELPSKKYNSS